MISPVTPLQSSPVIMKAVQGYNESVGGQSLHLYTPVTTLTRFFTYHLRCSLQRGRDPGGGMGGGKTPKFIDAIRRLKDRDTNNHIIFSYRYARMMRPDGPRDNFLLEPPPPHDEVERRHFQWPWTTATQFSRSRYSSTLNIWQTANDTAWLLQNANRKLYSTSFRLRRLVLCLMTLSDP